MPILKMSEARFNDLVYLTLKKLFFEPAFGEGHCPRECDIRVCMNMAQPKMLEGKGIMAAILSPTEVAPKSHTVFYDVDTDVVFDECKDYMEDHWFKQEMTKEWNDHEPKKFFDEMAESIMTVPEEKCGG